MNGTLFYSNFLPGHVLVGEVAVGGYIREPDVPETEEGDYPSRRKIELIKQFLREITVPLSVGSYGDRDRLRDANGVGELYFSFREAVLFEKMLREISRHICGGSVYLCGILS